MRKRLDQILNIVMGSSVGVCIGYGMYSFLHFKKYPELYAMQSSPWYSEVLVYATVAFVIIAVCVIIKTLYGKK